MSTRAALNVTNHERAELKRLVRRPVDAMQGHPAR